MVSNTEEILELTDQNREIIRGFGVKSLALVGSFARGEQNESSDVDFIVEFGRKSFDSFMELVFFLEDLFGREVDLLIADSTRERLKKALLEDAIYVQGL